MTSTESILEAAKEKKPEQLNWRKLRQQEGEAAVKIQRAYLRYMAHKKYNATSWVEDVRRAEKTWEVPDVISMAASSSTSYLQEGSLYNADRESVLVLGGIDPHRAYGLDTNTGKNMFRYVYGANQWVLVGQLPEPRHHHGAAMLKGRIYIAGGADPVKDTVMSTVWSLNPVTCVWCQEADLLTARKNLGLVSLHGKLMAVGGQDAGGKVLSSVEIYDVMTRTWSYSANLNLARTGAAVARFRNQVWVAGGMTASRKNPVSAAVEMLDVKSNQWVTQAPLRFPRCFGCLFVMNDVLYMIGGAGKISDADKTTSSCNAIDVWSPRDREWKLHFTMAIPRHGHTVAYQGTKLLIIGGVTTAYLRALADVECFSCDKKTWVRGILALPSALSGHGTVTLPPASLM